MKLTITSVDYAPAELHEQMPLEIDLLRMLPGPDRPDYWLGKASKPVRWLDRNIERQVTHLVVAARWAGTRIGSDFKDLPVGIAYVTDASMLGDDATDFRKSKYIAIGQASVGDFVPPPRETVISGTNLPAFGLGQPTK